MPGSHNEGAPPAADPGLMASSELTAESKQGGKLLVPGADSFRFTHGSLSALSRLSSRFSKSDGASEKRRKSMKSSCSNTPEAGLMQTTDLTLNLPAPEGGNDLLTAGGVSCDTMDKGSKLTKHTFNSAKPLRGHSFGIWGPSSRFRCAVRDVVTDIRWRMVMTILIWGSTLTLYIEPRYVHGEDTTATQLGFRIFDWIIVSCFLVDLLMKCIAWGCLFARSTGTQDQSLLADDDLQNYTYLGGASENRLDCLVIVSSMVGMGLGLHGVHALRALRVLPHNIFPRMRSVQAVFTSVNRSASLLVDNITILLFFILFFGICSVEFFAAGLSHKCITQPQEVSGVNTTATELADWSIMDSYLPVTCSPYSHSVFLERKCHPQDRTVTCQDVGNADPGWLNFDNLGSASLVIFQVIQLENWGGFMYPLFGSREKYSVYLFFMLMIVICRFIIINLFIAIIVFHFQETRMAMVCEDPDQINPSELNFFFLVQDLSAILPERIAEWVREKVPKAFDRRVIQLRRGEPEDEQDEDEVEMEETEDTQKMRDDAGGEGAAHPKSGILAKLAAKAAAQNNKEAPDPSPLGSPDQSAVTSPAALPLLQVIVPTPAQKSMPDPGSVPAIERLPSGLECERAKQDVPDNDREEEREEEEGVEGKEDRSRRGSTQMLDEAVQDLQEAAHKLTGWAYYGRGVLVVLLANVAIQATEHKGMTQRGKDAIRYSEYVFISLYAIEQVLRVLTDWRSFLVKKGWWFDAALVVLAIPALFYKDLEWVTRLRVFRVLSFSPAFCQYSEKVNVEPILSVFYMISMLVFLFAAIGMQFFAGLYDATRFPGRSGWISSQWLGRFHFDDLGTALQTLFLVMAGDNWSIPMYQAMSARSAMFVPAMLYFYFFFIISNWVLLSIFIAVLLQEFDTFSPLDRSLENNEVVTQSRSVFSNFLRRVDMGDHADHVDEENVASVVAVVNMHKWAARARLAQEQKKDYIHKREVHLGKRDFQQAARVLQGAKLSTSLQTCILIISKRKAQAKPQKGANKLGMKSVVASTQRCRAMLRTARLAKEAVDRSVAKEREVLVGLQGHKGIDEDTKAKLARLTSGNVDEFTEVDKALLSGSDSDEAPSLRRGAPSLRSNSEDGDNSSSSSSST
eukprot:Sspe_Gene.25843::Locus_10491_Transcript_1_1_Confidence_1.000_Length_3490::g.25843::m.25843/K04856/CACNA1I; voltage-dependent calcium channel T type alpha-1I